MTRDRSFARGVGLCRNVGLGLIAALAGLGTTVAQAPPEPASTPPAFEPPIAVLALARIEAARLPNEVFSIRLDDGTGTVYDRLRRDPERARTARLETNLLDLIGRPRDQPAGPGDIYLAPIHQNDGSVRSALLVESSTGYVAYFPQLGKGSTLGDIRTTLGRPFSDIASPDGDFTLLLRRGRNGRTVEAVLYHGPSGRAMRLRALDDLPVDPDTALLPGLPRLTGAVTGATIEGDDQRSLGYLLIDEASGGIHYAPLGDDGAVLTVRTLDERLFTVFPAQPETLAEPRFLLLPVTDSDGEVRDVLIIDAGSGRLAWLVDPASRRGSARLRGLDLDIDRWLGDPGPATVRSLAIVARRFGEGATLGAWLVDGRSRRLLAIDDLDKPDAPRVAAVATIR